MAATKTAKTSTKSTPETNGVSRKKEGLRGPQVRILACLAKAKEPLTRKQISEKAPVDLAFCTSYIGARDLEVRARLEEQRGYKSLLALGYVKETVDEEAGYTHTITASGRKALEKALKDA